MSIQENTTICAQATAAGRGAIAIIRISGPQTRDILTKIFAPAGKRGATAINPEAGGDGPADGDAMAGRPLLAGKMTFGTVRDFSGTVIDETMAVFFHTPHSYTGEDSAEIYCHGSQYIVSEILRTLMAAGAKLAGPGEFTQRAFLNGKMDLAQAEAVADLIASETRAAHDIALKQLRGGYSDELRSMRVQMLDIVSLMELELDFSEEDVEFADRTQVLDLIDRVSEHIARLVDSFALGNAIRNGIPVAIVGAVNTGKSTLLNAILGEERAIVSDIEGTTRDTIEDTVNIGGTTFRFIDTAGIRNATETIEIIGIQRTWAALGKASVILMMLDATRPEYFAETLANLASRVNPGQKLYILLNKTDLLTATSVSRPEHTSLPHPETGSGHPGMADAEPRTGYDSLPDSSLSAEHDFAARSESCSENASLPGSASRTESDSLPHSESHTDYASMSHHESRQEYASKSGFETNPEHDSISGSESNPDFGTILAHPAVRAMIGYIAELAVQAGLSPEDIIPICARRRIGIAQITDALASTAADYSADQSATLVTSMRHYQALQEALDALRRTRQGLTDGISTEFVAQDIREALYHIGTITGQVTSDEILGNIFGKFCIGK